MPMVNFIIPLLGGKPVAGAGEIYIEKGIIKIVTDGSGHYRPVLGNIKKNLLKELWERGYIGYTNREENIKFNHGF